jgi:hypothetical protein
VGRAGEGKPKLRDASGEGLVIQPKSISFAIASLSGRVRSGSAASDSLKYYIGGVLATRSRRKAATAHLERPLALGFPSDVTTANEHYNLGRALSDAGGDAGEALFQWRDGLCLAPYQVPELN